MKKSRARNQALHGNAPDESSAALLLVDVLNDLEFPGARPLVKAAPRLADNIARLKSRCRAAGIPAIYVNDNRGKWRSDHAEVVRHCLRSDVAGRTLVAPLIPDKDDYVLLKPKHSAFYATPLETLLAYMRTRIIFLVGLTTDACILTTAAEIHIRDFELYVPSDCVAAIQQRHHKMALELMKNSFGARTTASSRLRLERIISGA